MGLLKTLKTTKTIVAKVGNIQAQPVNNWSSQPKQSSTTISNSDQASMSAADSPISNLTGLTSTGGGFQAIRNPSLSMITNGLLTNEKFKMPGFSSGYNSILPSYLQHLKPKILRNDSTDDLTKSTREFEPYERLTGISHERPEVLMMTQFLPLFQKEGSHSCHSYVDRLRNSGIYSFMTDAGWYADTQINSRNLRTVNVVKGLRSLTLKNFAFKRTFTERKEAMGGHLDSLNSTVTFLLQLVRASNSLKTQLDLRDDIYTTKPQVNVRGHSLKFTRIRANWLNSSLQRVASKFLPPKYDIPDALVRLGFNRRNADQFFSSTKLWMQLLFEFKSIIRDHSLEFLDVEPTTQKNDDNAISITRSDVDHFNVKSVDPPGLLDVEALSGLPVPSVRGAIRSTSRAFSFFYEQGATFKSEESRIAALANILSREFNFSSGLAIPWVQRALTDFFKYTPNNFGNLDVFDNVIGKFGNNVSEIPSVETNSLANLAQRQPAANIAVLPFESKYLEGDNGAITPGSTWYVDEVFKSDGQKFNTTRLEGLSNQLKQASTNFSIVANGLNLFQVSADDKDSRKQNVFIDLLGEPARLVESQLRAFVDDDGKTRPAIRDDRLTAIYSMAQSSTDIKAILFIYTLNRINRSYNKNSFAFLGPLTADNTPLADALIDRLLGLLVPATRSSRTVTGELLNPRSTVDANNLDAETIRTSFKRGTSLTKTIDLFMSRILSAFTSSKALSGNRTIYSGHLDTMLMMVAFDLIIAMIGRYGNQRVVGRQQEGRRTVASNGKFNYVVSRATINFKTATDDLINRLEREQGLIHQLSWCVINAMNSLHNVIDGYVNYLKSPQALASLRAVSNVVNDAQEFQSLMSEQQIMMLGSTVHDVLGQFKRRNTGNPRNLDLDGDGDFDSDDEIKVLDDSAISPKLKNALYGLFGGDEFTESKAFNKRILTVGIPLGFTRRLQQKVSAATLRKTSFVAKQNDIVNITVYKIDMLNQDLIYKPKKFMVELSRFPVRNDVYFKNIPDNPTIAQLADAIPTRDFEESFEEGNNSIAYWRSGADGDDSSRLALDAETYDFLSQEEKAEIIKNHLMSYILEVYIKLMTGVSVAEHHFDIDPTDDAIRPVELAFVKQLTEHKVQEVSNFISFRQSNTSLVSLSAGGTQKLRKKVSLPAGGTLFRPTCRKKLSHVNSTHRHNLMTQPRLTNLSGLKGRISTGHQNKASPATASRKRSRSLLTPTTSVATNLNRLGHRHVPKLVHNLRTIAHFSQMRTSLSDGLQVSKQLLRPKQFDRVFNVIVDPDEFEIDYDKTMESEHGRVAFEMLMKRGDLVPSPTSPIERRFRRGLPLTTGHRSFGRMTSDPNVSSFKYRDRDKNQGDLMFEKYFITIETYDEEAV